MRRFLLLLLALPFFIAFGIGENFTWEGILPGISVKAAGAQATSFQDKCGQFQHKTITVPLATPSAKLIAGVAGTIIYVCAIHLSNAVAGATPAITIYTGTGTTCGTSTATVFGPAAGPQAQNIGTGLTTVIQVPTGSDLCVSDPTINLGKPSIEYVQQ